MHSFLISYNLHLYCSSDMACSIMKKNSLIRGSIVELRVLRYFLTVVREESITKAAEVLHITQPTLSRQLEIGRASCRERV